MDRPDTTGRAPGLEDDDMLTPAKVRSMIAESLKAGAPPPAEAVGIVALLTFADGETDELIGKRLGVSRRTISRWKTRPEYAAASAAVRVIWDLQMLARSGYDFSGWSKEIPGDALKRLTR